MAQKLQRNDPCPCGSGKKYKKCCMLRQRDLDSERINRREGIRKSLGWISHHYREEIDRWVEDVWLAGINKKEREGIATADARIRGIHDMNLLEQLVAEGRFSNGEGEDRPLRLILEADDLGLDENQRDYLVQLAERSLCLYRVSDCQPGESFTLKTYPAEEAEPVVIVDRWGSRMFDIGDTVGLRLMKTEEDWETSGAIYHIPEAYVPELETELQETGPESRSMVLVHYWLRLVAAHV
ncbi:MAG TPA: SEC-C domain-containing protein [Mariprofundaceae bacterium]|nr:SEC-C domain-containing protein [Mariprofundaceae bacterium]